MKRQALRTMEAVALCGAVQLLSCATTPSARSLESRSLEKRAFERRPNIVLILADDLGYGDLGCYGQQRIATPALDRLAAQGMRFTQHTSGAPVCAPSRCVLLTGRHTGHAEIRGNRENRDADGRPMEGQEPLTADAVTIAQLLSGAGYATAAFGKWGLGQPGSGGGPNEKGFDRWFGVTCQRVAHSYYPRSVWRDGVEESFNARAIPGHAKRLEGALEPAEFVGERHLSTALRDEALEWLRERRDDPRPFFLYLPFLEPHVALQPLPEWVERQPIAWDERPYRGQCGYTPHPRPRAAYAALVSELDDHVGRIVAELAVLGLEEETLVIFTSDNGPTHGHPADVQFGVGGHDLEFFDSSGGLRGRKGSVDEGGLRVPLLVRWPGRTPAGTTCDFPCNFVDWLPTLCGVAGIETPVGGDGIDLAAVVRGGAAPATRPPLVFAFPEYGGQVAVRFGDWKLLRRGLQTRTPGPWELYDLAVDPQERFEVAGAHPRRVTEGIALLRREIADNVNFPLALPE